MTQTDMYENQSGLLNGYCQSCGMPFRFGTENHSVPGTTDKQGNIVSQVSGVRINYRRGYLTTVSGQFLTAGKTSGGIHIDTDWEDDIIIEF